MTRLRRAELTSDVGVLMPGVGLGALFAQWLTSGAGMTVLAGAAAHAFGMWDKHPPEQRQGMAREPSAAALYWGLLALIGYPASVPGAAQLTGDRRVGIVAAIALAGFAREPKEERCCRVGVPRFMSRGE